MIACADMKNVYNHESRAINRIDCALYQCVRDIPVPAWMLKLGSEPVCFVWKSAPHLLSSKSCAGLALPPGTGLKRTLTCLLYAQVKLIKPYP